MDRERLEKGLAELPLLGYFFLDPKNLDKVFVERDIERKREQKSFFFRRGK